MNRRAAAPLVTLLIGAATSAGCGGGAAELDAADAWARPTPAGATDGVVYLRLTIDSDDTLVDVEVPATVASDAELHTSDAAGGGGHQHGAAGGGVVTMTPVEELDLDAGETVEFRPGGNHIMLIDLTEPLATGDTFTATLRFASERSLTTEVTVTDNPPG